jgi:hypothetical protein
MPSEAPNAVEGRRLKAVACLRLFDKTERPSCLRCEGLNVGCFDVFHIQMILDSRTGVKYLTQDSCRKGEGSHVYNSHFFNLR